MILNSSHVSSMTLEIWKQFSPRYFCFKASHFELHGSSNFFMAKTKVCHLVLVDLPLWDPQWWFPVLNIQSRRHILQVNWGSVFFCLFHKFCFIYLYVYFWPCWVSIAAGTFSSCEMWASHFGGFSCEAQALGCEDLGSFSSCFRSTGSVVVAHGLSCSCGRRDLLGPGIETISCMGRQILYPWATREAWDSCFEVSPLP